MGRAIRKIVAVAITTAGELQVVHTTSTTTTTILLSFTSLFLEANS